MRLTALLLILAPISFGAANPQIWFAPLDPVVRANVGYGGSPQYVSLFTPSAPWQNAASHVNVFKIYAQWLFSNNDSDMRAQFADLDRRGIALALEFGVLTTTAACGKDVEGFGGQLLLSAAQRIQQLGGTLRYIAMDEPTYFGTMYDGPNACHWTANQMAADAATNIGTLLAQFPDVRIGDIEPFLGDSAPSPLAQYQAGLEAFRKALGFPPAFFHADVLWPAHRDLSDLAAARNLAAAEGIPFGVLYDGTGQDPTDAQWIQDALRHMYLVESTLGTPEHVIFQSFDAYPKKLLPETDPASFTSVIDRYFLRRTSLQLSVSGATLLGRLDDLALSSPIANASVDIAATPATGAGVPGAYTLSAAVPQGTRFVVVGARVNVECGCAGDADLRVSRFEVGAISRDFSQQLTGWSLSTVGSPVATVDRENLHLGVQTGQSVMLNSTPLPFAEVGPVTFRVNAQVAPRSSGSGYFMLAFLNASGSEIGRVAIPFAPVTLSIGTVTTDTKGNFSLLLPVTLRESEWRELGGRTTYQVNASFAGSDETWPAQSEVSYPPPRTTGTRLPTNSLNKAVSHVP